MDGRSLLMLIALAAFSGTVQSQQAVALAGTDSSFVTYRLVHPLHVIEATSRDVSFRLALDTLTNEVKEVSATVDVMTFDSGNSNRDSHAMEMVDALTYPDATFSSTRIIQHNDSLNVTGKLVFHGLTKEIGLEAVRHQMSDKLTVDGDFAISLAAFQVERPSMLLLPVEDTLRFTVHANFKLK